LDKDQQAKAATAPALAADIAHLLQELAALKA
jgi:hypothetical protein